MLRIKARYGLRTFRLISVILPAALASGSQAHAQAQIRGAGATFPAPIYTKWFAAYHASGGASVDYQAVGSGAGINALKNREVEFGASDAPLSASEEAAMPQPVVHIPSVGGAVALTYNLPGVPSGLKLSSDVISDIFLGKITSWADRRITALNPGFKLPTKNIQPIHRTDGSGTTYIFTNYLKKASPGWAAGPGAGKSVNWPVGLGGKGSQGVTAVLSRTPGSIAYVELAYAVSQKLPYVAVRNKEGVFVLPSAESTTAAINEYITELKRDIKTPTVDAKGKASYPICSLTYILLFRTGVKPEVVKLWRWAMQPAAQGQAAGLQYAPLPQALLKLNEAALNGVH